MSIIIAGPRSFNLKAKLIEGYPDKTHEYTLEIGKSFVLALLVVLTAVIRLR